MVETIIRPICESQHRWLIVTVLTSVIGLVTLWPMADEYFAGRTEHEQLIDDLRVVSLDVASLPKLKELLLNTAAILNEIELRTISDANVSTYRGRIVEITKEAGCKLNRITVGSVQSRPWLTKDDPLEGQKGKVKPKDTTGLTLQKQPFSMTISGTMESLNTLLDKLGSEGTVMHVKNFELRPYGNTRKKVMLEIEIWLYCLTETAKVAA